jgi:hypothetical protein
MHKPSPHKELYDPNYHYTRGVLYFDEERYTFTAYRVPYQELDNKSWKTEKAFTADYRRMIERKYSV